MAEVSTLFISTRAVFFVSLVSKPLTHEPLLTKRKPFPCGRYVHGLKVVCPPYPDDQNRWRYVLDVFDFNVHPKKLPEDGNTTWNSTDPDHERANDSNSGTPRSSSSLLSTRPSTSSSSSSITHEVSYTVHTEPSFVPASDVFISDVVSKLPYTHTVRKDLCAVYSGFMIDDERLIGLKVGTVLFFSCVLRWVNVRYVYRLRRMEKWGI